MYGSAVPAPPPELPWNPSPTLLTRSRTTTSVPHPPPPSTASPTTSPTPSTTRSGRLRGLSYLRNYTHNHLLSRDSNSNNSSNQRPPTLARATSYPSSTSPTTHTAGASATSREGVTAQRLVAEGTPTRASDPDTNTASTSGWLPTAGGLSGVEITASEPQSTIEALNSAVLSSNGPSAGSSDLEASMARTRHVPATGTSDPPPDGAGAESETQTQNTTDRSDGPHGMHHQLPSVRFTAHQDPRAQRPSLVFSPISRILPSGKEVIKVGRYSERDNQPIQTINVPSATPVGFKSKVVSRRHCEFWCSEGRWYIKDVKSSSGTFLNHIRLSSPGTESRPFPVNDGDIVQLGIDFKGGEEMIFRCVKIRVELNKGWQHGPSSFNVQSHKRLRELNSVGKPAGTSQDCSICLGAIAPCQSLFVAPCSHTWHYKCIRVIINGPHWPHFICPNCRAVADLEAELDEPSPEGDWEEVDVAEAAPPTGQPADGPVAASHQDRAVDSSEATQIVSEAPGTDLSEDLDDTHEGPSEASDESEPAHETVDALGRLNIEETVSPHDSSNEDAQDTSHATVPAVDIVRRKPTVNTAGLTHLADRSSHSEHYLSRTPTSNRLSVEPLSAVEGPMTPRNDVGPFIFDGTAGRASEMNLGEAANFVRRESVPRLPPTS